MMIALAVLATALIGALLCLVTLVQVLHMEAVRLRPHPYEFSLYYDI